MGGDPRKEQDEEELEETLDEFLDGDLFSPGHNDCAVDDSKSSFSSVLFYFLV